MTRTIRVLVADDNTTFRRGLRRLLESDPLVTVVGETDNGLDVVEIVKKASPDVVLLDIRMPGQSGLAVARHLRACFPQIAIIIVTSYDSKALREEARRAGIARYWTKSVDPDQLLMSIRETAERIATVIPSSNPFTRRGPT